MKHRRALWFAVLLAGCASPDPVLYTIAVVPGAPSPGGPAAVDLREVAVAHYLQRNAIVRSSENYRIEIAHNDWWGEPLGAMTARVLSDELTQRLPGTTVFPDSGAITVDPGATVEISLTRLDADRSGAVILAAQVAVRRSKPASTPAATRTVRISVTPADPSLRAEVAAMSAAVGQLADQVAEMLRQR